MIIKKVFIIIIGLFLFNSCDNGLQKALIEMQKLPPADRSYIVQPVYKADKESSELIIKELFSAETVRIGAVGMHKYNEETSIQEDEKFWLKVILLNSQLIIDFSDESKMNDLGREVANNTLKSIVNKDKYDLIQITFVKQDKNETGIQKRITQNIFYTIPDLELTDFVSE